MTRRTCATTPRTSGARSSPTLRLEVEQAHTYVHPVLLEPWLERAGCTGKDAERVRELVAGRLEGDRVRLERICLEGRKRREG